jgi:hypothetical protein
MEHPLKQAARLFRIDKIVGSDSLNRLREARRADSPSHKPRGIFLIIYHQLSLFGGRLLTKNGIF